MSTAEGSPNGGSEISDFVVPRWSPVTGDGLDPAERAVFKDQEVLLALVTRLAEDDAWTDHVARVRQGESAGDVAAIYGSGQRRSTMATLLERAAAGRPAVRAFFVPDEPPPGRSSYHYRAGFWLKIIRGVDRIVRLGGGRCLDCGEALNATEMTGGSERPRKRRVLYCEDCWTSAGEIGDRDAIAAVFDHVASALLPGGAPARDFARAPEVRWISVTLRFPDDEE